MSRDRRCRTCRSATSSNGAPTVIVVVVNGEDVYACDVHRAEHAAPAGDQLVALAQYQDMAARPHLLLG
ncbi:glycosyl hydrolase family 26 [Streptomyces laurentii]|uniref:Glycosyl hydrolase family 26 n=1 Tax=Streptomyces laurentii TaxID=39478 RepID=A0A160NYT8_STRLU|nr:glycosyl hydrolase family 26 [Streptomyces laurentii]